MKLDDDGSTGAAEMSRFHQLVAGKRGAAPRHGAPGTGSVAEHGAKLAAAENRPAARERAMRAESMEDPHEFEQVVGPSRSGQPVVRCNANVIVTGRGRG